MSAPDRVADPDPAKTLTLRHRRDLRHRCHHPGTPSGQMFRVEGGKNRYIHEVTVCTTPKCGKGRSECEYGARASKIWPTDSNFSAESKFFWPTACEVALSAKSARQNFFRSVGEKIIGAFVF